MTDDLYQVFYCATSLMEAEMIKGLLESEGIAARIPGELASDHFTTSRETSGDVEVRVPRASLDAARAIIARAKEEGKDLAGWLADHPGDETPPPGPDPS